MPLYDFKCADGHKFERMVPLADFDDSQHCACGTIATRVISPIRFSVENVGYDCPITGEHIGSKVQHNNNLAKHGCRVYETGETEQAKKAKASADAEFEKRLDITVEKHFESLPSAKKEALATELTAGADLGYNRSAL